MAQYFMTVSYTTEPLVHGGYPVILSLLYYHSAEISYISSVCQRGALVGDDGDSDGGR